MGWPQLFDKNISSFAQLLINAQLMHNSLKLSNTVITLSLAAKTQ